MSRRKQARADKQEIERRQLLLEVMETMKAPTGLLGVGFAIIDRETRATGVLVEQLVKASERVKAGDSAWIARDAELSRALQRHYQRIFRAQKFCSYMMMSRAEVSSHPT